jgi:hypothetical protein
MTENFGADQDDGDLDDLELPDAPGLDDQLALPPGDDDAGTQKDAS